METNEEEVIQAEETVWIERRTHERVLRKYRLNTQRLIREYETKIQQQNRQIEKLMKEVKRQKSIIDNSINDNDKTINRRKKQQKIDDAQIQEEFDAEVDTFAYPRIKMLEITKDKNQNSLGFNRREITHTRRITNRRHETETKKPSLISIHIQPNLQHLTNAYICDQCNKTMSSRRVLAKHKRMVHCLQKEFVCDHCSKAFCVRDGLKRHLRIHTGEKPFVCRGCQKGFNQSGNMRIHEKTCKKRIRLNGHLNEQ